MPDQAVRIVVLVSSPGRGDELRALVSMPVTVLVVPGGRAAGSPDRALDDADVIVAGDGSAIRWLEAESSRGAGGRAPVLIAADDSGPDPGGGSLATRLGGRLPALATAAQVEAAIAAVRSGLEVSIRAPAERRRRVSAEDDEGLASAETLTHREAEVLQLLALGFRNRAISERLGISPHTVKFHVASILGKLGVATRTEAVREGLRQGLLTL